MAVEAMLRELHAKAQSIGGPDARILYDDSPEIARRHGAASREMHIARFRVDLGRGVDPQVLDSLQEIVDRHATQTARGDPAIQPGFREGLSPDAEWNLHFPAGDSHPRGIQFHTIQSEAEVYARAFPGLERTRALFERLEREGIIHKQGV